MNWENVETKRLLLKGWDASDIPFVFEHFSDAFVCQYLYDAEPFTTVDEAEQLVTFFSNENNRQSNRWVIIDKSNNQRIGTCGYMFWDTINHSIEIGYDLQQSHAQKGIMTEALTAVIDLAFREKGINRIQAITYVGNAASFKLLEKLGFQQEGVVRDKHYFRGRYYDHYCYSLLKKRVEYTTGRFMITEQTLTRDEIPAVWHIDRREVINAVYYLEAGTLVLKPEHHDVRGWSPDGAEKYTPLLEECYDQGGWFYGLFDEGQLIGVAVLENRFIGAKKDQLQLKFLHVSHGYRDQGLGKRLFKLAQEEAHRRGAKQLYISATPSEHTIRFYRSLGCQIITEPDPELFALEPEDIHLVCDVR